MNDMKYASWTVEYVTSVRGREILGIAAYEYNLRTPGEQGDRICVVPGRQGGIGEICLRVTGEGRVPLQLDDVRFAFSTGNWPNRIDNDGQLKDISIVSLSDGGAVYVLRGGLAGFADALSNAIDSHGTSAQLRLGLIRGDWESRSSFSNESRFAFFELNGFRQAWEAMRALRSDGYKLLAQGDEGKG